MLEVSKSILNGEIDAPSSKSHAIRYVILSGLANEKSSIEGITFSEDLQDSISLLKASGSTVEYDKNNIVVNPSTSEAFEYLQLNGSATVLRIATAIAASYPGKRIIHLNENLRGRPLDDLIKSLVSAGAIIRKEDSDIIFYEPIKSHDFEIDPHISSQFLSALLFVGPASGQAVSIKIKGKVVSKTYLDISINTMREIGFKINIEENLITLEPRAIKKIKKSVPGDFALSSYFPVIVAKNGNKVKIKNLYYTGNGDSAIIDIFKMAGYDSKMIGSSWVVEGPTQLNGIKVNMVDVPDLIPPLCSLLASAKGESKIIGLEHLKFKETDRISEMIRIMRLSGINVSYDNKVLTIKGGNGKKFDYECPSDHRMGMMALSMQALNGGRFKGEGCLNKSYPNFIEDLKKLGGDIYNT